LINPKVKEQKLRKLLKKIKVWFQTLIAGDLIAKEINDRVDALALVFPKLGEELADAQTRSVEMKEQSAKELAAAQKALADAEKKKKSAEDLSQALNLLLYKKD
jgi:hypothetical protein